MTASGFGNRDRRGLCAAIATLALWGCGGGGGGGSGSSAPAGPDGTVALPLTTANISAVSSGSFSTVSTLLKVAMHASSEVARLARNGTLQLDYKCSSVGKAHYTLIDNDGNGVPSAGDVVQIDYTDCPLVYMDGPFDGTLIIRLASADDPVRGAISGTIDFGAGLSSSDSYNGKWFGTLDFQRVVTLLQDQVSVAATTANDLHRMFRLPNGVNSVDQLETYQNPQLSRVLQRDTARVTLTGSLGLESQRIGGRVDIALASELSAYLNSDPDSGSLTITGATGSRIVLPADPLGGANTQATLDANGDGVIDSTTSLIWNSLFTGFLWSEQNASLELGSVRNDLYLAIFDAPRFNQNQGVDVDRPVSLQINRPVSSSTVIYAWLIDHGPSLAGIYGTGSDLLTTTLPVIDVDVSIHGALIAFQPHQNLQYGHDYQLLISSVNDQQNPAALTLTAATPGPADLHPNGQVAFFNSDDMLWPAISGAVNRSLVMPGVSPTISAIVPTATSLPLRFQWSQVDGPPLTFGTSTVANTTVQLPAGSAPGIAIATLRLTITDAIGRISITPFQMQTANLAGAQQVLYFNSSVGDPVGVGATRAFSEQTGTFTTDTTLGPLTVNYHDVNPAFWYSLQLISASGGVPPAGNYTGVEGIGYSTDLVPKMAFDGGGSACGASSDSFQVLELQLDVNGVVQKLAADFQQLCTQNNTPAPLHGSIRINSSLPIPP